MTYPDEYNHWHEVKPLSEEWKRLFDAECRRIQRELNYYMLHGPEGPMPERLTERPEIPAVYLAAFTEEEPPHLPEGVSAWFPD